MTELCDSHLLPNPSVIRFRVPDKTGEFIRRSSEQPTRFRSLSRSRSRSHERSGTKRNESGENDHEKENENDIEPTAFTPPMGDEGSAAVRRLTVLSRVEGPEFQIDCHASRSAGRGRNDKRGVHQEQL